MTASPLGLWIGLSALCGRCDSSTWDVVPGWYGTGLRYAAGAVLGLLAVASFLMAGLPHREQGVYHDALVLGGILPKSSVVGLTDDLANDWPLQTNLARWDF